MDETWRRLVERCKKVNDSVVLDPFLDTEGLISIPKIPAHPRMLSSYIRPQILIDLSEMRAILEKDQPCLACRMDVPKGTWRPRPDDIVTIGDVINNEQPKRDG